MEDENNGRLQANTKNESSCSRLLKHSNRNPRRNQPKLTNDRNDPVLVVNQLNKPEKRKGRWFLSEHYKFQKAVMSYGTNWRKIRRYMKTRTAVQIRTHSQKYLMRLQRCKENSDHKLKYRRK